MEGINSPGILSTNRPDNLVANWSMEDFYNAGNGDKIAVGWNKFVLSGTLSFADDYEHIEEEKSQRLWTDWGQFEAGIYQRISWGITPGQSYMAFYCTASKFGGLTTPVMDGKIGRTVGIDPFGGTDPGSSNIVWGTTAWNDASWATFEIGNAPLVMGVVAQESVITLFAKVTAISEPNQAIAWIDAVTLIPDHYTQKNFIPIIRKGVVGGW